MSDAAQTIAPPSGRQTLPQLLDAFPRLRVAVIGEAILDSFLEGEARGLCREAPVPVIAVRRRRDLPGGAANTAVNARSLGAEVMLVSLIGDDSEGRRLRRALRRRGVRDHHVVAAPGRRTLAKHRLVADAQLLVRFDQGSDGPPQAAVEDDLGARLEAAAGEADVLVVSDYGTGLLTPRLIAALRTARARPVVVDSRHLAAYRAVGPTAVKPNFREAMALMGSAATATPGRRAATVAGLGDRILELTGAQIAAVTLDAEGALVFERGRTAHRTWARRAPGVRVAGAGDTFTAALALALAAGADAPVAAELAAAAAGVVVGKERTATCTAAELRLALSPAEKWLPDLQRLAAIAAHHRADGRRVVFTNGCFDILHRGHVAYLSQAKALGDVLVVAVNSDASVRRLKGRPRPIIALEDRLHVLAALSCVDHLIAFDDDAPIDVLRVLRPDVYVKGGDYTRETLPEAPLVERLGGEVVLLPHLGARSTSGIISRIRAPEPADAARLADPAGAERC
jgi:D-beta-D-heptose 7-phosphate kinase/D-beta-D-heptose 1-phosphate adenosyltransferase